MKYFRHVAVAVIAHCALLGASHAQTYPNRPIKLVVPYGPGASTDLLARMVAQQVSEDLKQPVVVDNRAGASGMIGSDLVAKSAPDGYTFLLGTDGTHTGNPHLVKSHPFHAVNDVTAISMAVRGVIVLAAHPSLPVSNVEELIRYAKANPGKLSFGNSGNGSPHHMAAALFNQMAGTDIAHIAYKGGGPAMNDLLGGQIPVAFTSLVTAAPHIKAGKLKALAVTDKVRYKNAPEIPAVAETLPGYVLESWLGFLGPAGMPAPVVKTLNASINRALHVPAITSKLEEAGLEVIASTPEQFTAQLKSDYAIRGELIRKNNIKAE